MYPYRVVEGVAHRFCRNFHIQSDLAWIFHKV